MTGTNLVYVTDGAPQNMADAREYGFATRADYAAARRRELEAAIAEAGISLASLTFQGVPDQQAARCMPALARRLAELFTARGISVVLTHAYEGGHPDHDATTFVVHAACGLVARTGEVSPNVIEMPHYHLENGAMAVQTFVPGSNADEIVLTLDDKALEQKRRMMAAHATQERTLAAFIGREERFRPAPTYDFRRLPNNGALYYAQFAWGSQGHEWQTLADAALRELGQ